MEAGAAARGDRAVYGVRAWQEARQCQQAGSLVEAEARAELACGGTHHAAAQGGVERAQSVNLKGNGAGAGFAGRGADGAAPSANGFAGQQEPRQDAAEFRLPARLVLARQLGQVGQRLVDGGVELPQQRQDAVADAVAREGVVGVRGVRAPALVAGFEEVDKIGAADSEQRAQNPAGALGNVICGLWALRRDLWALRREL